MIETVSVGTCNMDFIFRVPSFVRPDSEMNIEEVCVTPGGSAFNFAAWTESLGLHSGIVSVGSDYYGKIIRDRLASVGVDTGGLSRGDKPTGMAFISVDAAGRRSIYSYTGANAELEIGEEECRYIESAGKVHLTGCYIEVALSVAGIAEDISFSPGTLLAGYGLKALKPVVEKTEMMFLNDDELRSLTGLSVPSGALGLIENGAGNVVVTHGPSGASFFSRGVRENLKVRGVRATDTTGAGDAFAAGFMVEWLGGSEPLRCLEAGHETATRAISRMGAF
ncbi:carbohydrate kinase family protein [Methanothermobacter wolfeii]|uniref:Carbohydrate kinase family protein n=1 Tax=Methanothermobacter wolfeii TaxID=145261 RepID=A0ABU8TVI2_METWO